MLLLDNVRGPYSKKGNSVKKALTLSNGSSLELIGFGRDDGCDDNLSTLSFIFVCVIGASESFDRGCVKGFVVDFLFFRGCARFISLE